MKHISRGVIVFALIALPIAPAAANAQSRQVDEMSAAERESITLSRRKPPRDNCTTGSSTIPLHPEAMPRIQAITQTIDSSGYVLYSAALDTLGALHLHVLESNVPATESARVAGELGRNIIFIDTIQARPARRRWTQHTRLRLENSQAGPSVKLAPSVMCPPSVKNRQALGARIAQLARGLPKLNIRLPESVTVVVWVLLRKDGSIERAQVHTSSGYQVADDLMLELVEERAQFEPAVVDHEPFQVWVQLPLIMRSRQ